MKSFTLRIAFASEQKENESNFILVWQKENTLSLVYRLLFHNCLKFRTQFLKTNNHTVPNKKVRLGKIPEINNGTAYDYLDP